MAASPLKDDEWVQGTVHEAVTLPVRTLGVFACTSYKLSSLACLNMDKF